MSAPNLLPPPVRTHRAKPDANPLRLMLALAGVASASALVTAMLPSIAPTPVADASTTQQQQNAAVAPAPSVIHVQRVVQLAPGQTAPPNTSVQIAPQPTPHVRVKVVTVTRQSGKP